MDDTPAASVPLDSSTLDSSDLDIVSVLPTCADDKRPVLHDIPENDLLRMHRTMTLTRALDQRGMLYQRQGRLGFYLPSTGEEALQAGSAWALRADDWIFPSYRVAGIALWRGASIDKLVANCFGNADDNSLGRQMPVHYSLAEINWLSISSPLGTQIVQCAGAARAMQIKGEKNIAVTYFGDGSTSTNDFHTGLNFAGVWKAPAIFFCQNNQWAISTPLSQQCAAARLVDKAIGYGMPGVRVDGNDVLAVAQVVREAVERARSGGGPTFIEALSYRMGPHSSSDDPTRYRPSDEVDEWARRDPIARFRNWLLAEGHLREEEIPALEEECAAEISASFKRNEQVPKPELASLFDDVYGEMPEHLREQRDFLVAIEGGKVREDTSGAAFPL
ncbi:MAG: thiamine pyrophosphate-dependent dehydrogenase E1 component subunit alpha [Planctomycetes bacterium]|nr:thiamine pyrophosphate-dependent dehydrogenase E1 component subunit alpha [Planctomycetota bacterium]